MNATKKTDAEILDAVGVDGEVVYWPDAVGAVIEEGWYASEDSAEEHFPHATSARAAREEYVAGYDQSSETQHVDVRAWRRVHVLLADGSVVIDDDEYDDGRELVEVEAAEPSCIDDQTHSWCSPHQIVGGSRDNPGVWGHGGGVVIVEACRDCGCGRRLDTWAQDSATGQQGLQAEEYEPGRWCEEFRARGAAAADEVDLAEGKADLSGEGALYVEGFADRLCDRGARDVVIADGEDVQWVIS